MEVRQPEEWEGLVVRALEVARRRAGLTVDEMVRRLRPVVRLPELTAGRAARHNWYDWRRRPHSIPAVALLAAAELAGVSVDRLLGKAASEVIPPEAAKVGVARVESLERRVAILEAQVAQIRADLVVLRQQLGDIVLNKAGVGGTLRGRP